MEKHLMKLPFEGFYNSHIDGQVDFTVENWFNDNIPDEWYNHFSYSKKMIDDLSKLYVSLIQEKLKDDFGLSFPMEFVECVSPREYNFTTDKIYVSITPYALAMLGAMVDKEILKKVIEDRHTSYDGFASFYSNDYDEWMEKPITQWDEIELETLFIAAIATLYENLDYGCSEAEHFMNYYDFDTVHLYEDASGNGVFDDIIFNNMSKECQDMVNNFEG